MYLHAGAVEGGIAGELLPNTFGYADQPSLGGFLTPTLNLFHRTSSGGDVATGFSPLAKVEGPLIFGGCSELCCPSQFTISGMVSPDQLESSLKTGDLATITKERPHGACACIREAFTDSDHFTVTFKEVRGATARADPTTPVPAPSVHPSPIPRLA